MVIFQVNDSFGSPYLKEFQRTYKTPYSIQYVAIMTLILYVGH